MRHAWIGLVAAGVLLGGLLGADPVAGSGRWQRRRAKPSALKPEPAGEEEPMPVIDPALLGEEEDELKRRTCISIQEQAFILNKQPTYKGCVLKIGKGEEAVEHKIEGLLFGFYAPNAIFDDLNPETRDRWKYRDGPWDAERNTRNFIDALPYWRRSGADTFTVNLQGVSPEAAGGQTQPWVNSAYTREGRLRADYMDRLESILEYADEHYMVVILALFDHGQDQRVWDERSVLRAVDAVVDWLLERRYTNVLIDAANACNHRQYDHEILTEDRVHEVVERIQDRSAEKLDSPAGRLLVGASVGALALPPYELLKVADFVLLQGNGVNDPGRIRRLVGHTRERMGSRPKPMLFNADDGADFTADETNLMAAALECAGWALQDYRRQDEGFYQGLDTPPADWSTNSLRKCRYLEALARLTRHGPPYRSRIVREAMKQEKR